VGLSVQLYTLALLMQPSVRVASRGLPEASLVYIFGAMTMVSALAAIVLRQRWKRLRREGEADNFAMLSEAVVVLSVMMVITIVVVLVRASQQNIPLTPLQLQRMLNGEEVE
jgi:hypothetical protein